MARTEIISGLRNVWAYKPGQLLNASDGGSDPTGYLFTNAEWETVKVFFTMRNHKEASYLLSHPVFVRGGAEIKQIADGAGLTLEKEEVTQFT